MKELIETIFGLVFPSTMVYLLLPPSSKIGQGPDPSSNKFTSFRIDVIPPSPAVYEKRYYDEPSLPNKRIVFIAIEQKFIKFF